MHHTVAISPVNLPGGGLEAMCPRELVIHYSNRLEHMMRMCKGSLPTKEYRSRISPNKIIDIPSIENRSSAISWMKEVCVLYLTIICLLFVCITCYFSEYVLHLFFILFSNLILFPSFIPKISINVLGGCYITNGL